MTLFHGMIHKEIEVYVDDMITKSISEEEHLVSLRKLFERLRKFKLRSEKLLSFIISQGACNTRHATSSHNERGLRFSRETKLHC